jgi:hypothetical protein
VQGSPSGVNGLWLKSRHAVAAVSRLPERTASVRLRRQAQVLHRRVAQPHRVCGVLDGRRLAFQDHVLVKVGGQGSGRR